MGQAQEFKWVNPYSTKKDSAGRKTTPAKPITVASRDTLSLEYAEAPVELESSILKPDQRQQLLGNLQASGAIVRGISFGNNQGQSVQSTMDLQITGKLTPDISVLASISDTNLPIQADGYTQTLEEFDRIFIQATIKDRLRLRGGHLELIDQQSFFTRYQRRGLGLEAEYELDPERKTFAHVSAGLARSEFHRIRFQGIEGNQGPYRLVGRNNEQFITIISGSEQVFIDGILMKRGETADYVMNYATGEVTFTSFRPILRQNFITISYNYTNRNYTRYLATGTIGKRWEKWQVRAGWFWERDNKNAPLAIDLSEADRGVLAAAGNDPARMYSAAAEKVAYDASKILYEKVDDGDSSYYQYSTNANADLYAVNFTYAGSGKGDYTLEKSEVNGRVFKFVGFGKGDFLALKRLPAPEQKLVMHASAVYTDKTTGLGTDVAYSVFDPNTFSSLGNSGNSGFAARVFGRKSWVLNKLLGQSFAEFQHIGSRFHILDRINDIEFSRDFNLPSEFSRRDQTRLLLDNTVTSAGLHVRHRINVLNEKDFYRGIKNDVGVSYLLGNWSAKADVSLLDTRSDIEKTKFFRTLALIEKKDAGNPMSATMLGGSSEHNVRHTVQDNRLEMNAGSFSWREIFIRRISADSLRKRLDARLYYRVNDSLRAGTLGRVNDILGLETESELIKKTDTQLSMRLHYRKILDQSEPTDAFGNQDFILGNVLYSQNWLRSGLRLQAMYELGNGQEPQRDFQYLKVNDGQGMYKWTDYNGDGVQQTDEFEIAEYQDLAQYIRVYTNSIQYRASNKNKLQASLYLSPYLMFNSQNQTLQRLSFNFSVLSQNSFLKKDKILDWNPFLNSEDQLLKNQNILGAMQISSTATSGWNGGYRFTQNTSVLNANDSREERTGISHMLNAGYRISSALRGDADTEIRRLDQSSQLFASRNFSLKELQNRLKFTWQLTQLLQAETQLRQASKKHMGAEERLDIWDITGSLQVDWKKLNIRGSYSFIQNDFKGNSFSVVGNQMLEGLKPGKNQVWSLTLQQSINSFLQLNLLYQGRTSGERTIHTGSMQLRAGF